MTTNLHDIPGVTRTDQAGPLSVVPTAQDGVVLTGIKAEPLRGGLRPALTPAPGATNQAAIGTTEQTEHSQNRLIDKVQLDAQAIRNHLNNH